MANKATKLEAENRLNEIIDLILQGLSRFEILQFASKKWGIESRQVDDYRRKAMQVLVKRSRANRAVKIARAEARYTRWLRKAEEKGDLRLAAEMQDRLVRLGGLAAPDKPNPEGDDTSPAFKTLMEMGRSVQHKTRREVIRLLIADKNGSN